MRIGHRIQRLGLLLLDLLGLRWSILLVFRVFRLESLKVYNFLLCRQYFPCLCVRNCIFLFSKTFIIFYCIDFNYLIYNNNNLKI